MRSLIEDLYGITEGATVVVRASDSSIIEGVPSRIERTQAGIRIELCPFDRNDPQYRVRATRTPTGWCDPSVERCPVGGEWERCGHLVCIE